MDKALLQTKNLEAYELEQLAESVNARRHNYLDQALEQVEPVTKEMSYVEYQSKKMIQPYPYLMKTI